MAQVYRKIVINQASEFMNTQYGYKYNVEVWTSIDNENFYYCGIGRFCKTITEASNWIETYTKENGG